MRRLFAMFRYNKKLLVLAVCLLVDVCLVLSLCTFDIVQFIQIRGNAVRLSSAFVPINIVLIVLATLNLVGIIAYIVIKIKKEKADETE